MARRSAVSSHVWDVFISIRILLLIALTLPLVGAAGLIILHARGERLLSVQTASMVPAFRPGDALFVSPVRFSDLRTGDIVSYRSPKDPRVLISHRLIGLDQGTGKLITAGDALPVQDPPVSPLQIAGRATAVAPGLGRLLDALHRLPVLAAVIYVPAALITGYEVRHFRRRYRRPAYLLNYRYGPQS